MEKGWPWPLKGGMALDATAEIAVEAVADGPVARESAPEWALRGSLPPLRSRGGAGRPWRRSVDPVAKGLPLPVVCEWSRLALAPEGFRLGRQGQPPTSY